MIFDTVPMTPGLWLFVGLALGIALRETIIARHMWRTKKIKIIDLLYALLAYVVFMLIVNIVISLVVGN